MFARAAKAHSGASANRNLGEPSAGAHRSNRASRAGAMVVVMLVGATFSAAAQDMQGPRLSHIDADWTAAAADLEAVTAPDAAAPDDPTRAAGPEAPSDAAPPTSLD